MQSLRKTGVRPLGMSLPRRIPFKTQSIYFVTRRNYRHTGMKHDTFKKYRKLLTNSWFCSFKNTILTTPHSKRQRPRHNFHLQHLPIYYCIQSQSCKFLSNLLLKRQSILYIKNNESTVTRLRC